MEFAQLLKDFGVDDVSELEATSLAFVHEIANTLFEPGTPFDEKLSDLRNIPEVSESMLTCKLRLLPGKTRREGLQYLMQQWYLWLMYEKPRYEGIQRSESAFGTEVKIFVIGQGSGCSFTFTIVDHVAEEAVDDFIGGYGAIDNPAKFKI
ncbi:hypothetical protein PVT68_16065 [Microbulbifer bruguierae]|uniref:Uncharacterized protein n=1 Tax=Microbulbifer bruguierae TaxID=3029061 RepID=A0ABY8NC44_9GAMM|nr:hypothetical protein [Microbulbifer bruguierae]WGL16270.1 hypothetical protein PVT68_16065 [Microbulbifer bruguierae]